MLPLYSNATKLNLDKIHKIIVTAARAAIGNYCYKKSISYILSKCNWLDINELLHYSCINIIHKTLILKYPESLMCLFRYDTNHRQSKLITTKYIPTTEKFRNFYIYKFIKTYNKMDSQMRNKSIPKFKKEIKQLLRLNPISDTFDWLLRQLSISLLSTYSKWHYYVHLLSSLQQCADSVSRIIIYV